MRASPRTISRPGPARRYNPGPPVAPAPGRERDPAARRRAAARAAARAAHAERRVSWAACGCSPAAPSTRRRARATTPTAPPRCASCARRPRSSSRTRRSSSSSRAGSRPRRCRSASTRTSSSRCCRTGQEPRIDGEECVDLGWFTPAGGAQAPRRGRDRARLPDDQAPRAAAGIRHRRALLEYARGREVVPVEPRSCSRARSRASCCRATPATDGWAPSPSGPGACC